MTLSASFGFGKIDLSPIVKNPSASRNNENFNFRGFLIKDAEGILNKNNDFDYIYLSYNLVFTYGNRNYDTPTYEAMLDYLYNN